MLGLLNKLLDVVLVAAGALLAQVLYDGGTLDVSDAQRTAVALLCALTLIVFPAIGVYDGAREQMSYRTLSRVLLGWLGVAAIAAAFTLVLSRDADVSLAWLGRTMLMSGAVLLLGKASIHGMLTGLRRPGAKPRAVAIVGSEVYGRAVLEQLRASSSHGYEAVCVFDDSVRVADAGRHVGGVPVVADLRELKRRVRAGAIDEVWLALPLSHERQIQRIVREFRHDFVNLRFLPDVRGITFFNRSITQVVGMPAINLATSPLSIPQLWPKFMFDRLFALAVLIPLSPILASLALAVKLSSPGPVLFRQKRKGVDGREFEILKFRTMRVHAEEGGVVRQASRNDSRITKVGAFLRRTSLDELPQFFNVLFGQMSVVGPRPHALEHDDIYKELVDGYMYRYRVRPGITGWAQVNGYRGETRKVEKMAARVKFDLFYMQNWTFWFDIKIILITLVKGFVGRNAF
ncbi:undecaprenyl-phosphate glucose phosphotransferase [Burkholderia oklahomensis]|uniref:Undecaprenyl-phosphate glucose phosphotransferase n=1 Tax=Burkholderia oklahomensis TaxID=342113 RepID=A0AAI8B670_9BURK|nr:undecaprenyl-phosphate glucose phosphotransferase [Burkholderia oklahomensis]AIO66293.1 undecaprenyl-phosphate glucose phosphotransferase [Burkholderia oklahomensis]AOI43538.1 undecaprenyl-phosphate glucose phosphotransferase [Burkholderia oklahomensis EO147]KUY49181.1 undecaprenyl-phosphate glucose phosphotransferase [Burkholderia oklahomensis EO147]QPS38288.1 undecaprenyl-phosphate glucose phosphotransferase [Burkholderia oklahomensis]